MTGEPVPFMQETASASEHRTIKGKVKVSREWNGETRTREWEARRVKK